VNIRDKISTLPKRVLNLLFIALIVFVIFAAVKINIAMILVLPVLILLGVYFLVSPEIALGAALVGQNLFAIPLALGGAEKPIVIYLLIGISVASCAIMLVLTDKAKIWTNISPITIPVILLTVIFMANLYRTEYPYYATVKTFTFVVACLIPYFFLQFLAKSPKSFIKAFDYALILSVIPLVYSLGVFFIEHAYNSIGRFRAFELVHVNHYARNMGYIVVIAFWRFFNIESKRLKTAIVILICLNVFLIVSTGSRTSTIATLSSILFFIVAFSGLSRKMKAISVVSLTAITSIPFALGLGSMLKRFMNLKYMDLAVAGRMAMWKSAWEHRFDKIMFGFGTGNFAKVIQSWQEGVGLRFPHNIVIEFYIEWGIVGLAILIALLLTPFWAWYRIYKSDDYSEKVKNIANLAVTLFIFSLIASMTDSTTNDPQLFINIGMISALYLSKKE